MTDAALAIDVAIADDIAALHTLVESAYRGDTARRGWTHEADLLGGQRTDSEALHAMINDPRQHILLARHGDMLIGCVNIADVGNGIAYLGLLAVHPDAQAGGIGRHLISAAERHAIDDFAASAIEMTVIARRIDLIAYYERRGYRRTGEMRPFPYADRRFGQPKTDDLDFAVLAKTLRQI